MTRRNLPGHSGRVNQCAISGDGGTVASVSSDGSLRLCSTPGASASQVERAATVFTGSAALSLSWETRGDRLLLFGTAACGIKIWNADAKKMALEMVSPANVPHVTRVAMSPDGSSLMACCNGTGHVTSVLQAYSLRGGKPMQTMVLPEGVHITDARYNHNGTLLATAARDGYVRLFDVRDGGVIMQWHAAGVGEGPRGGGGEVPLSIRFGADETSLISCYWEAVDEWSAHMAGRRLARYPLGGPACAAPPAAASADGAADPWLLDAAVDIALSPSGRYVAAANGLPFASIVPLDRGAGGPTAAAWEDGAAPTPAWQALGDLPAGVSSLDWARAVEPSGRVARPPAAPAAMLLTGSADGGLCLHMLADAA